MVHQMYPPLFEGGHFNNRLWRKMRSQLWLIQCLWHSNFQIKACTFLAAIEDSSRSFFFLLSTSSIFRRHIFFFELFGYTTFALPFLLAFVATLLDFSRLWSQWCLFFFFCRYSFFHFVFYRLLCFFFPFIFMAFFILFFSSSSFLNLSQ